MICLKKYIRNYFASKLSYLLYISYFGKNKDMKGIKCTAERTYIVTTKLKLRYSMVVLAPNTINTLSADSYSVHNLITNFLCNLLHIYLVHIFLYIVILCSY